MRNKMVLFLLKVFSSAAAAALSAPGRKDTMQLGQEGR
jgi:hypothetical protein